jgi:hypothetical protein
MKPTAHIAIRYEGHTFTVDRDKPVYMIALQDSGTATQTEGPTAERIRRLLILGQKAFKLVAVLPEGRDE